jgi:lipopolysaccharide/colanic/teichoic acid biosynthesis glycosyltransferase
MTPREGRQPVAWSPLPAAGPAGTAKRGLPRWADVTLSALAFAALSPVLLASMVLVKLTSRGPALFRQQRVGQYGRPFELVKVRTMRVQAPGALITERRDLRITPVGRVLRLFKIDEIPQFWNVLRGDMALVGPRPEVPRYVRLDDDRWRTVLSVRPGLTDPVTIALRSEEHLLADVAGDREEYYVKTLLPYKLLGYQAYVRRRTAGADLWVILLTGLSVVLPSRVFAPSSSEIAQAVTRGVWPGNGGIVP